MPTHFAGRGLAPGVALLALLTVVSCDGNTGPDPEPPTITTSTLPDAEVGEAYTAGISATGGDGAFTWSLVGGTIPPGLALSVEDLPPNEALITGTPDTPGRFEFRIEVESGEGLADTAQLSIGVVGPPEPVAITTIGLPPTIAGGTYGVTLQAAGGEQGPDGEDTGEFDWAVVEGSLPPGLQLGPDGQFNGTAQSTDTATFTVEVRSAGFTARKAFTLRVIRENTDRYDVTPFSVVPVPASLEDNVRQAIERWEAAIIGDLPGGALPAGADAIFDAESCGGFGELVNGTSLDDILIMVNISAIDGPGQVVAQAGPCAIRGDDTPVVGILTFDREDLVAINSEETITDVIQHEMAHVIGFGSLWNAFGLIQGAGTNLVRYIGDEGVAAYQSETGAADSIPVESGGGAGTRDAHWREDTFDEEIMTGFVEQDGVDMPLSRMTIASFADMGYEVDLSAADPDALALTMRDGRDRASLGYDILGDWPIIVVHRDRAGTFHDSLRALRP